MVADARRCTQCVWIGNLEGKGGGRKCGIFKFVWTQGSFCADIRSKLECVLHYQCCWCRIGAVAAHIQVECVLILVSFEVDWYYLITIVQLWNCEYRVVLAVGRCFACLCISVFFIFHGCDLCGVISQYTCNLTIAIRETWEVDSWFSALVLYCL